MKIWSLFAFSVCFIFAQNGFSQKPKRLHPYCGISLGNETMISLPRVGILKNFPLNRKQSKYLLSESKSNFYVTADVSIFCFVAAIISPSVSIGLQKRYFTIDNSLTYTYAGVSPDLTRDWFSTNPKIGWKYKNVWFKTGPCFYLNSSDEKLKKWLYLNGLYMNFDLIFFINNIKKRH